MDETGWLDETESWLVWRIWLVDSKVVGSTVGSGETAGSKVGESIAAKLRREGPGES